jgi:carbon-monoxide dehydrogenase large subunit
VNPLIIDGQTHGGIVQGLGQALFEQCFYDAGTGQLLSGSFMDYAMPRADVLPFFDTDISEVPTPTHPLGIRPAGEGGTTPALAVTINAIVDALREFGVRHVEMPATFSCLCSCAGPCCRRSPARCAWRSCISVWLKRSNSSEPIR